MHCRNSVALAGRPGTAPPLGTELLIRLSRRATDMLTGQIAALCKRLHKVAYVKSEIM